MSNLVGTLKLTLSAIDKIGSDLWLITFSETISALPGQYITISHPSQPTISRSYSLCNKLGSQAQILVRRLPNGILSRYLTDIASTGSTIAAFKPQGKFVLSNQAKEHVFIAGGSGIAPIRPLIEQALILNHNVHLLYAARDNRNAAFYDEFVALEHFNPLFNLHFFKSSYPLPRRLSTSAFEDFLRIELNQLDEAHYYLCGPFALMRSLQIVLYYKEVEASHIHTELFEAQAIYKEMPAQPFEHMRAKVSAPNGNTSTFNIRRGEYVLNEALNQGLALPYSCRGGICSSCLAKLTAGDVIMTRNEVLSEQDKKSGLFLPCTALPITEQITFTYL